MMNAFRRWCEKILRIPPEPEPPPGDEATARIFRAAPAYLRLLMIMWVISNLFIFLFFTLFFGTGMVVAILESQRHRGAEVVAVVMVVALLFMVSLLVFQAIFRLAVMRLAYEKRWYVVTDRSLRVREGVVHVREMTVSFANIQDVAVTQGPIERMLGLFNIRVATAGGGSGHSQNKQAGPNLHQAWFRGIDNAEEVRNLILERLRALKDSGLGHREEQVSTISRAENPAFRDALAAVLEEARSLRQAACGPAR